MCVCPRTVPFHGDGHGLFVEPKAQSMEVVNIQGDLLAEPPLSIDASKMTGARTLSGRSEEENFPSSSMSRLKVTTLWRPVVSEADTPLCSI